MRMVVSEVKAVKPFIPLASPGFPVLFDQALWSRAARIAHMEVKNKFECKFEKARVALPLAVAPPEFEKQQKALSTQFARFAAQSETYALLGAAIPRKEWHRYSGRGVWVADVSSVSLPPPGI